MERPSLKDITRWDVIYEPPLGSVIDEVCEAVLARAKATGTVISFRHNGTVVRVHPNDTVEEVFEKWKKQRPDGSKQKQDSPR